LKARIVSPLLLGLCLAVIPAIAQTDIYDNGPINGTVDAWTINSGYAVSDSFTVGAGGATVNGLSFGFWEYGQTDLRSADVAITSAEFGGTTFFDGTVNFTDSGCSTNQQGYYVCTGTGSFNGPTLSGGTYWLTLENACCDDAGIFWDENSGPSSASENQVGTIPSESFTILGATGSSSGSSTPEPSSIMLFGSGVLGLAGVLRRKLF
jgi:PEP-CTERM motif